MKDRWEWLEGLKPESPIEVAVKYVASMTADALASWPPAVRMAQDHSERRFGDLLERGAKRPSLPAFEEAIKRARWELQRDYDAIDFYARNNHVAEACPAERDQVASEFIEHYILESFFTLMEKTEYRVKRKDVLVGLDMVERRIKLVWFESLAPPN